MNCNNGNWSNCHNDIETIVFEAHFDAYFWAK